MQEATDSNDDNSRSSKLSSSSSTVSDGWRVEERIEVRTGGAKLNAKGSIKMDKSTTVRDDRTSREKAAEEGKIPFTTKQLVGEQEERIRRKRPLPGSNNTETAPPMHAAANVTVGRHKARKISASNKKHPASTVLQQKWNRMFDRLLSFKAKHGHCLVPNRFSEDPALGAWVSTQRRQYKILVSGTAESTPMTPERAAQLESVGFVWATTDPRHVPWETRFQELREYKSKYGDCLVPITFQENLKLANWVSTQRQEYKLLKQGRSSRLNPERVKALDSIGFVWAAQRGGARVRKKKKIDEDIGDTSDTLVDATGIVDGDRSNQGAQAPHDHILTPNFRMPSSSSAALLRHHNQTTDQRDTILAESGAHDVRVGRLATSSLHSRGHHRDNPLVVSVAGQEDSIRELLAASAREGQSLIHSALTGGIPAGQLGHHVGVPSIPALSGRATTTNQINQILASLADSQNLMSSLGLGGFASLPHSTAFASSRATSMHSPSALYQNLLSRNMYSGLLDPLILAAQGFSSSAALQALQQAAGNAPTSGVLSSLIEQHGNIQQFPSSSSTLMNQSRGLALSLGDTPRSLLPTPQHHHSVLSRRPSSSQARKATETARGQHDSKEGGSAGKSHDVFDDADE
mmetsp:Transcript_28109/g.39740  ORF Transcript_28109/g.39740 Transcript_28109/m.39740 type:complete len:633 (+) Transcript_28109:60-1958(+)